MATIIHTRPLIFGRRAALFLWEALTTTDLDGDWLETAMLADMTVQAFGSFTGTPTITMQGSNDTAASKTAVTLTDPAAVDVTFTAAGGSQILENYAFVRPLLSGGDGSTDIDVFLCAKGDQ